MAPVRPSEWPLTPIQARFVQEYLVDLNGAAAAVRAGYSRKSAAQRAYEMRRNPAVAAAIAEAQAARAQALNLTQEQVVRELAAIAFANVADYEAILCGRAPLASLSREQAAGIAALDIQRYPAERGGGVKGARLRLDKRAALVALGRHLGMFDQRHPVAEVDSRLPEEVDEDPLRPVKLAKRIATILLDAWNSAPDQATEADAAMAATVSQPPATTKPDANQGADDRPAVDQLDGTLVRRCGTPAVEIERVGEGEIFTFRH